MKAKEPKIILFPKERQINVENLAKFGRNNTPSMHFVVQSKEELADFNTYRTNIPGRVLLFTDKRKSVNY